ncbi:G-protein coupled receptor Mth2-like [Branchiostoma floridae x Branchiostoma belcheri]
MCSDTAQSTPNHQDEKWKCVPGFYKGTSYWLVGDCPDDWTDDVTRQQCLKEVDSFNPSELAYRMPVHKASTDVSYRNIFCAFCNNVSLAEVVAWDSSVECTGLINSSTHTSTSQNTQVYHTIVGNGTDCPGTGRLEFVRQYGRQCFYHEADPSSVNCEESTCMSYRLVVRSRYKKYNNIHCALCEGISLTASANLEPCVRYGGDVHHCFPKCISLTNLFNFGDEEESGVTPCPLNSVYDPFVDTCRLLKVDQTSQGSGNGSAPLQNCSAGAVTFTAEEFEVLPNGSVHLLSANVTCPAEQVAIQNATALVCGECVLQYFSNDTRGGETTNPWEADQGYLTLGLVVVSVVAVVAFVFYSTRPDQWKKMSGKLKVQMILCMTAAESLFVGRVLVPTGPACTGYAILLHYLLLTAFSSMNALSLDLFLTFRQESERAALRSYMLYTWLMPVLFVVLTVFVEFCPCSSVRVGYGQQACWIGNPTGSLVVFGVPVMCALLANLVLIIHTLLAIRKSFKIADAALVRSDSSKAWVYLRISFLTGFTWIIGFIVPYVRSRPLEYIFIVLNASQGLLLTLLLTMTSDVMVKWMSRIRERFRPGEARQGAGRQTTSAAGTQQSSVSGTARGTARGNARGTARPTARGTRATAHGTNPAIDIPMKELGRADKNNAKDSRMDVIEECD